MEFLRLPGHAEVMRVLIAEDELRLADAIARGLRRQGFAVDLAPDGDQALVKSRVVRYDVLVLDRDLPGVHGDDVCKTVRDERPETGILMLTAAGALEGCRVVGEAPPGFGFGEAALTLAGGYRAPVGLASGAPPGEITFPISFSMPKS